MSQRQPNGYQTMVERDGIKRPYEQVIAEQAGGQKRKREVRELNKEETVARILRVQETKTTPQARLSALNSVLGQENWTEIERSKLPLPARELLAYLVLLQRPRTLDIGKAISELNKSLEAKKSFGIGIFSCMPKLEQQGDRIVVGAWQKTTLELEAPLTKAIFKIFERCNYPARVTLFTTENEYSMSFPDLVEPYDADKRLEKLTQTLVGDNEYIEVKSASTFTQDTDEKKLCVSAIENYWLSDEEVYKRVTTKIAERDELLKRRLPDPTIRERYAYGAKLIQDTQYAIEGRGCRQTGINALIIADNPPENYLATHNAALEGDDKLLGLFFYE